MDRIERLETWIEEIEDMLTAGDRRDIADLMTDLRDAQDELNDLRDRRQRMRGGQ